MALPTELVTPSSAQHLNDVWKKKTMLGNTRMQSKNVAARTDLPLSTNDIIFPTI
jgi:hypothetical protein